MPGAPNETAKKRTPNDSFLGGQQPTSGSKFYAESSHNSSLGGYSSKMMMTLTKTTQPLQEDLLRVPPAESSSSDVSYMIKEEEQGIFSMRSGSLKSAQSSAGRQPLTIRTNN